MKRRLLLWVVHNIRKAFWPKEMAAAAPLEAPSFCVATRDDFVVFVSDPCLVLTHAGALEMAAMILRSR